MFGWVKKAFRAKRSDAHKTAHQFWKDCSNTFLAGDPTYYDRQEIALRATVSTLQPSPQSALDIGCGNGRFSMVLAEYVPQVRAFDLSEVLIQEAIKLATERQSTVRFESRDLEQGIPEGEYELVTCMGVTSTLIDEAAFSSLLDSWLKSVKPGMFLITKDSLSETEPRAITSGPYVTIYRSKAVYEDRVQKLGFKALGCKQLAAANGLVNCLYLWQKAR